MTSPPPPHGHAAPHWLRQFVLPRLTWPFLLRLTLVAAGAWWLFSTLCIPAYANGDSMLPTSRTGQLLLCWTPAFRNHPPKPGDIVMIAYSGHEVMLLKRVLATEGETVAFANGQLLVNGQPRHEPWLPPHAACDWNRPPETVRPGHAFVAGDNRAMPLAEHLHGQVSLDDIVGQPLGHRQ